MLADRYRGDAEVEREASDWLARWRLSRLTAADAARFDAWRQADPRNAAAFAAVSCTLETVSGLQSLAELEPLEREAPAWRRRWLGGGVGAIAAALAAVVALPAVLNQADVEASTLVAEIRPITLEDGTRVTLGGSSEIKVHFDRGERRVRLIRGEAFFEVAEDAGRPFVVDVGGAEVRDIGTSFDVRRAPGRIEVGVLEGIVEIHPRRVLGQAPAARLTAGQRVRAVDLGLGPIIATASVGPVEIAPAAAGAWREGQLAYDDARLADIIADLNRYYAPGVRLEANAAGELRLAASFKAGEIDKFLTELPSVAPVRVWREGDGQVVVSERSSAAPRG